MDHAATLTRFYELMSAGEVDAIASQLSDDFIEHEQVPGLAPTKEGVLEFFRMYKAAFPDLRVTIHDVIASGDKVVARASFSGTHQGEFLGIPPTGKTFDIQVIDIVRFGDDGMAVEHWGVMDSLTMMQQLGLAPEGPA